MKTGKKHLLLLFCITILAGTLLLQVHAAEVIEYDTGMGKIEFDPATGTITDSRLRAIGDYYSLVIPEEINGVPVTSIGTSAFQGSKKVMTVTLPDSLISIGDQAFRACDSLSEITFGKNLEIIGKEAFYDTPLNTLTLPDSLVSIGDGAFSNCNRLTDVIIGKSVESIGMKAFERCSYLKTITFLGGGIAFDQDAFIDCHRLESVYVKDAASWCANSFSRKTSSPMHYAKNFYLDGVLATEIVIPEGVTSIGQYALYNCTQITGVTIPASVTTVGQYAFNNATNLDSAGPIGSGCAIQFGWTDAIPDYAFYDAELVRAILPDGLHTIGTRAFFDCVGLQSVVLGNGLTTIHEGAFLFCSALESVTFPDSMRTLGENVFASCSKLAAVTLNDGLPSISSKAFQFCEALTEITIPDSVQTIGESAFYGCTSLTSLDLGSGVQTLGKTAFAQCYTLPAVHIPASLTLSPFDAFYHCSGLCAYTVDADHGSYSAADGVLFSKDGRTLIHYPESKIDTAYLIPTGVTVIGEGAFRNNSYLFRVVLPEGVTEIGKEAFRSCYNMVYANLPDTITSVGADAFYDCPMLSQSSGTYFRDLESWCNIDFGSSYSNQLFYSRDLYLKGSLLRALDVPAGITAIKDYAFNFCRELTSLHVDADVTSIGKHAFYGCPKLGKVEIGDGVRSIGAYGFGDCDALTEVTIGDGVTAIEEKTFWSCDALTTVILGDGITSIGNRAFSGCKNIEALYLGENLSYIDEDAFYADYFTKTHVENVYYSGTREQWFEITNHEVLTDKATIHFNYRPEHTLIPTEGGNLYLDRTSGEIYYCDPTVTAAYIPAVYDNVMITSVGEGAFAACTALTDVFWQTPQWYWEIMIPVGEDNVPLQNASQHYIEDIPVADATWYPSDLPGKITVESLWAPLPVETIVFCAAYDRNGKLLDVQEMILPPALSVETHDFYLDAEAPAEVRLFSALTGSLLPFTTFVEAVTY